jgi:hypothetical protein
MATPSRGPSRNSSTSTPVRILSVPSGQVIPVLFLSGYDGLDTHHTREQPVPCEGPGVCSYCKRKVGIIWKGYAPVLAWDQVRGLWHPFVLEITEALEELLRGRELRGEVWHLFREGKGKRNDLLTGLFAERKTGSIVIEPFDYLNVLLRCYHVSSLRMGRPNTMPARVVLPALAGEAPALPPGVPGPQEQEPNEAKRKTFRELIDEQRQANSNRSTASGSSTNRNGSTQSTHEGNGQR